MFINASVYVFFADAVGCWISGIANNKSGNDLKSGIHFVMKILIIVSKALLGGHVLSAFTIAKHLKKRGHVVVFAGGHSDYAGIVAKDLPFEAVDIPMYHGREDRTGKLGIFNGARQAYFTWDSFGAVTRLKEIIMEYDFDLIHAFDARAYVHATIAALSCKKNYRLYFVWWH